ncbi:MAG: hypothetical protein QUS09_04390 [Methanotrichaceae archaeon]|nr:hypothetical protein [Methanotrichaceae archaeon]
MKRYESEGQPQRCPKCLGTRIARVLYGHPCMSADLQRALKNGTVVLGGCCLTGDDPKWQCTDCGTHVYRQKTDKSVPDAT